LLSASPLALATACCWGTLSETFSKLSDSLFWEDAGAGTLFVNLFVSATAKWRGGAVVQQASAFPYGARATTTLTVVAAGAAPAFTLAIRVPGWAASAGANQVTVNGAPVAQPIVPGAFFSIARTWADGDVVVALFPPSLRFEAVNDARPPWRGVGAVMYGAMLLASANASSDAFPLADTSAAGLASAFARVPPEPPAGGDYVDLVFRATSSGRANFTFIPLADILFERYAAYVNTSTGASGGGGGGASAASAAAPLPLVIIGIGAVCAVGLVAAAAALFVALRRRRDGSGAASDVEAAADYVEVREASLN